MSCLADRNERLCTLHLQASYCLGNRLNIRMFRHGTVTAE